MSKVTIRKCDVCGKLCPERSFEIKIKEDDTWIGFSKESVGVYDVCSYDCLAKFYSPDNMAKLKK